MITTRYMRKWFWIDFLAVFPFEVFFSDGNTAAFLKYVSSLISCRRVACPFLYSSPIRNLSYLLHRPVPQSTFDLSTHSTHVVLTRMYRLLLTHSVIKCLRLFRIFKLVKFMDKFKFANLWRMFRLFASLAGLCHFLGCFWVSARITGANTRVE